MKAFKIIITLSLLVFIFCPKALAEGEALNKEGYIYEKQFEVSGASDMEGALSEETKSLLNELGIDPSSYQNLTAPSIKGFFKVVLNCILNGIHEPFKVLVSSVGIILIFSLINAGLPSSNFFGGYNIFLTLILSAIVIIPLSSVIDLTAEVLKGLSSFLTIFVPVLAGILSAKGYTLTAGGMQTAVLAVSQFMSHFVSLLLVPVTKAITCLGLCGSLSSLVGLEKFCALIKNGILWCFGTASAIFLSIISMQTAVSAATDSTALRTSKSIVGGLIPVMGPLISESLSVAGGCLNVLKTGVGIYGILALLLSVLPILTTLVCFKGAMLISLSVAELFCINEAAGLFRIIDFCLSVLIGSSVFILLVYIISFGTVLKTGGSV